MTSSPGSSPNSMAAISMAAVHEWVSKAWRQPISRSSQALHRFVNGPSPERCPLLIACSI